VTDDVYSGSNGRIEQPFRTLIELCRGSVAEVVMPQGRQKSPGSFRDELGEVIERVAPDGRKRPPRPEKSEKGTAETNDRLFWRRPDEKA
jgi:hypothetical protein